jgi:hypothetical protein
MISAKSALKGALYLLAVMVGGLILIKVAFAFTFVSGLDRIIKFRERTLLYEIDHPSLEIMLRAFATEQRWAGTEKGGKITAIRGEDRSLPPGLKLLKPTWVNITDDQIDLEFGGAFIHYGISAFRQGLEGSGTKKLGNGLWFYSDDGKYPNLE